jgi:hypothetical protein
LAAFIRKKMKAAFFSFFQKAKPMDIACTGWIFIRFCHSAKRKKKRHPLRDGTAVFIIKKA